MDPLSDVLSLLRPSEYAFRGLEAGGSWSLHYPADGSLKCFAITFGSCWLYGAAPIGQRRLLQGDVVMVSGGTAFLLCSDPAVEPVDVGVALTVVGPGNVVRIGNGMDCAGLGGYFGFGNTHASTLLAMLPEVLHVASGSGESLRQSIARLMEELRCPRPGGASVGQPFCPGPADRGIAASPRRRGAGPARVVVRTAGQQAQCRAQRHSRRTGAPLDSCSACRRCLHVTLGVRGAVRTDRGRVADGVRHEMAHAASLRAPGGQRRHHQPRRKIARI